MNFKIIIASVLVIAGSLLSNAQSSKKALAAHNKIHSELAKAKTGMDKSVIKNMLQEDLAIRENTNSISDESRRMLADLLSEAKSHIGKPYRGGAKGPYAFDCSGFSSYVYKQFGYSISPSSKAQFLEGTSVDRTKLREGDLVFFTSRRSGKSVGHVGIVVSADNESGNFKFIHASSSQGIKIDNCAGAGYYEGRFLGARRIINE